MHKIDRKPEGRSKTQSQGNYQSLPKIINNRFKGCKIDSLLFLAMDHLQD